MLIVYLVLSVAIVMFVIERRYPGRPLPRVRGFWRSVILLNAGQVAIAAGAGSLWEPFMDAHRLWAADGLGTTGGAIVGYLASTFVYYWWHRWRHAVPILWRSFHQVHHSVSRIEVVASFYKHPLEVLVNGVLSSAILYLLVGVSVDAAIGAVLLSGLAELFYHCNVRTPRWVGFVFQRPESHCLHHARGLHFYNFSDLPLWDMLFGTFRNPRTFEGECGFLPAEERRLGRMLLGVDVVADDATRLDIRSAAEWAPSASARGSRFAEVPGRPSRRPVARRVEVIGREVGE